MAISLKPTSSFHKKNGLRSHTASYLSQRVVVVTVACDFTSALVLAHCDAEEAVLTPMSSPGVLDNVEGNLVSLVVADSQDAVVRLTDAEPRVVDTAVIEHESVGDVEGNGNRLNSNGLNQSINCGIGLNASTDGVGSLANGVSLAVLVTASVRVILRVMNLVVQDIVKSKVHQASVTTVISILLRAVN